MNFCTTHNFYSTDSESFCDVCSDESIADTIQYAFCCRCVSNLVSPQSGQDTCNECLSKE